MQFSLPILIGAALADSVNPVAFGVLLLLISSLGKKPDPDKIASHGLAYILGFFLTSLLLGLVLLPTTYILSKAYQFFYPALGLVIAFIGLTELFKHFRPKNHLLLHTVFDHNFRKTKYSTKIGSSPTSAFILGSLVSLAEIPISRGIYLATLSLLNITLLAHSRINMLALYNLILISPLILITLTAKEGLSTKRFQLWQKKYHSQLHLGIGSLLTIFGLWLVIA